MNKRKPNLLFFWFLLPFILYAGYGIGKLEDTKITISNLQEILLYALTHPWPLRFTVLTVRAIHNDPNIFSQISSVTEVSVIFMIGFVSRWKRGISI